MLPQKHRLRRTRDIVRVRRSRVVARGSLFTVRTIPQDRRGPARFAIIVGKRVSKKATERNRLLRQIRASVVSLLPSIKPGSDTVIIAERPFSAYSWPGAAGALRALFAHVHLLLS